MIDIRHSENLAGMSELLVTHRRKFTLVYMDPPFRTGKRQVGPAGSYEDPAVEMGEFTRELVLRVASAWQLLNDRGCLVVHVDPKTSHYAAIRDVRRVRRVEPTIRTASPIDTEDMGNRQAVGGGREWQA